MIMRAGKSIFASVGYGLLFLGICAAGLAFPEKALAQHLVVFPNNDNVLEIVEGFTGTSSVSSSAFNIATRLSTRPSTNVTVNYRVTNNSDVGLSTSSLTFTPSNWNALQRVYVTAPEDNDADNESATVYITASGAGFERSSATVDVLVLDNDSVIISPTSVTMNEGATATIKVKLAVSPGAGKRTTVYMRDRIDNPLSNTGPVLLNGQAARYGYQELTFTSTNWNVEQTVTLTAQEENNDYRDDSHSITFSPRRSLSLRPLEVSASVSVRDNDRGLVLSPSPLNIDEGSTGSFKVKLVRQPTANVRVTLTQPSNTDVTVNQTTLDFTSANWNTDQTVTVNTVADRDIADDIATIPFSASGGGYAGLSAQLRVNVRDRNDRLLFSHGPLEIIEGQNSSDGSPQWGINVKLDRQPTGNVSVTLQSNSSDLTVARSTLTFTTGNWNTHQLVTIRAPEDNDATHDDVLVALTASGGGFNSVRADVNVRVIDNDLVVISPASLTMDEGGTANIKVKLAAAPDAGDQTTVYMRIFLDRRYTRNLGFGLPTLKDPNPSIPSQKNFVFDSTNWNVEQTLEITAVEDTNTADDRFQVSFTPLPTVYQDPRIYADITVRDNDNRKLTLSSTSLNIDEGSTGTFDVELFSQPTANVTVTLRQPTNADVTVNKTTLDFTTSNWNTKQTVTVSVATDDDITGEVSTISLSAAGGGYDGVSAGVTVNTKEPANKLVFQHGSLQIGEGFTSIDNKNSIRIKLQNQPSSDVTISLQSNNSDLVLNKSTLTFTTSNWNTYQIVSMTANEDDDAADDNVIVAVRASGGGIGSANANVDVRVIDNDLIVVSPDSFTMTEGETVNVDIKLARSPGAGKTTTVYVGRGGLTINGSPHDVRQSVSFDSTNWNMAQTITVTADEDDDFDDRIHTMNFSPTEFHLGIDEGRVSATVFVKDNDRGLVLSTKSLDVNEGGTSELRVKLAAKPSANVTVTLTQPSNTDVTLNKTTLNFTTANWNTDQAVTVRAGNDNDSLSETTTIPLSAAGGGYNGVSDEVTVNLIDSTEGLRLSTTDMTISEGSSGTDAAYLWVRLPRQPSANVTVTVTQPSNTDVTVDKTSLTFTTGNWGVDQVLRVSAAEDNDVTDDKASIVMSASGGGFNNLSGTVSVTVTDDDTASLVLPSADVAITEGGAATFEVKLATQTNADVTVTLTQPANTDIKVDTDTSASGNQNTLTFTSANWNTAQTVTVRAAEDGDASSERTNIFVSAAGGGYDDAAGTVNVALTDDDRGTLMLPSADLAITEGNTATFDVSLSAQPSASVTVTLAQPANTDIKVDTDTSASGDQTTLTFTTSNWNTARTVTVRAAEDNSDTENERAEISVSAAGGGYGEATGKVSVALTDDDSGSLSLSSTDITLIEGNSATFDVGLTARPSANVVVTLVQPTNTDVKVDTDSATSGDQTTLTFTTSNWNTARTVTLTAAEDNNDTENERASVSLTAAGGGYGDATGTVNITLSDNDAYGLILPPAAVAITEGESASFAVKLTRQPSANVTVTLTQATNPDIVADTDRSTDGYQTTLTFTASNWNTEQTVTLFANEDGDTANESTSVSLSASGGGYSAANATGTVNIALTDDDVGYLTLSTTAIALTEGGTSTFDMRLTARPSATVTVRLNQRLPINTDVRIDTDTSATGNQNTLTFTTSNWDTNQRVTVRAAEDNDRSDESATIGLSAAGGGYGDAVGTVNVTLTDDDAGHLVLSTTSVNITEGGTASFTVNLTHRPSGNVTVQVSPATDSDIKADTDTSTAGDQDRLTFTNANWNTAQPITLRAIEDNDIADATAKIFISASGAGYDDAAGTVNIALTDNDRASLTYSKSSVSIVEGGTSATFGVKLTKVPTANVTVTVNQPSNTDVKVDTDTGTSGDQNTLTFTTSNWNNYQTVAVRAIDDNDSANESATITLSANGGGYINNASYPTVGVQVTDDDAGKALDLPSARVSVFEGESAVFDVKLTSQPSANVTVTLTQPTNTDVTVDKTSLTFTSSNWDTNQKVRVRAAEDNDTAKDSASISVSAAGGGYDSVTGTVNIDVTDDDVGQLTLSTTDVSVDEASSATFTVKLTARPSADVTVTLVQPTNTDVTVDKVSLGFTTDNWNTNQIVTVRAADDRDATDDSATISITALGGGYGDATGTVRVDVEDNDTGRQLIAPTTPLIVGEGNSATFDVKLATPPSGNVMVSIAQTGTANTDVTVSPASLTFTTGNWSAAQRVTVNGAEDDDGIDDSVTLQLSATGGDYDDVDNVDISVTVDDNDTLGLTVSKSSLTVNENSSGNFTVKLDTQPSENVRVTITQKTGTTNADVTSSPSPLTFTTGNWSTAQTVTVNGAEDNDGFDDSTTLVISATGGGYDDVTDAEVEVTVDDNDPLELTVSKTSLTVDENSSGTFTVKLNTQPSGNVRVTITQTGTANSDISATPNSLAFTTGNWNTAQTVTVSGADDADGFDDTTTLQVSATDGGYDDVSPKNVSVEVDDDDSLGITVSATSLTVDENSSGNFTVELDTQPSGNVTVNITQPTNSNADITTSPTSLTFTTGNWNTAQTVTVNGAEDEDGFNDSATLQVKATDGGYDSVDAEEVVVTVRDNDPLGKTVSVSTLTVEEG
ncbi:MAG: hypothetical protein ISN28_09260, partial [Ectothiorhodospiraceae bacterium AqS1]|nr:hypothetical protein [Ectothiorhodospiraceae bacterium AqS1]